MIDVKNATTKELVEFYNEHAERQITKFASREIAERRVQVLQEQLDEATMDDAMDEADELVSLYGTNVCPHCGVGLDNGVLCNGDEDGSGTGRRIHLNHEFECMACGEEFGKPILRRTKSGSHSEAIKQSWKDERTKEKRAQRSAVKVDGEVYPSVRKAFLALGLPIKEHVRFRMKLKQKQALKAYDHTWKIVPLNYEQEDV